MRGLREQLLVLAVSTIWPAYITWIRCGHAGHDAKVVGDQDAGRRAGSRCERLHELEDLGLDRDVERGGGLVGDEQLAGCRRARSRSSRAGACRRRTGGDSRRCALRRRGCRRSSSSSIARSRAACSRVIPRCSCSVSLICSADRQHGVQARSCGSWKIIAISSPRTRADLVVRTSSACRSPSKMTWPSTIRPAGCGISRISGQRGHALAAARLAHDAERLSFGNRERDAIDCA